MIIIKVLKLVKWFFNFWYKWFPPEMVQYWKTGDVARAKLVTLENGSYAMIIEGEKYPLYGFPRGPVLFGALAHLKYLTKNLVFNQSWKLLEEGKSNEEVMNYMKSVALPEILKEIEKNKYDFFPPERLCPAMKELWRAMTVIEKNIQGEKSQKEFFLLKQGITFFFQEDDSYRFRLQWIAKYLNPKSLLRKIFYVGRKYSLKRELEIVFNFLENAEIVMDMKLRIRLIKRILFAILEDKEFGILINAIVKELDWKKLYLSKSDKYYFRGKYFKVDLERFDY